VSGIGVWKVIFLSKATNVVLNLVGI